MTFRRCKISRTVHLYLIHLESEASRYQVSLTNLIKCNEKAFGMLDIRTVKKIDINYV